MFKVFSFLLYYLIIFTQIHYLLIQNCEAREFSHLFILFIFLVQLFYLKINYFEITYPLN